MLEDEFVDHAKLGLSGFEISLKLKKNCDVVLVRLMLGTMAAVPLAVGLCHTVGKRGRCHVS